MSERQRVAKQLVAAREVEGSHNVEAACYEAAVFLYDEGKYSSGDDVRMLLSHAAFHEIEALLDLLDDSE